MLRHKKGMIIIIVFAMITAAIFILGRQTAGNGPASELQPEEQEEVQTQEEEPTEESTISPVRNKDLERIYTNTYIYYDEFLEGKPITYTFYEDGTMVAYYWEDGDKESIPLSSQWAEYTVNDSLSEITIKWDDGTKTTDSFQIKRNAVVIGEAEFKLSDREIHLN